MRSVGPVQTYIKSFLDEHFEVSIRNSPFGQPTNMVLKTFKNLVVILNVEKSMHYISFS